MPSGHDPHEHGPDASIMMPHTPAAGGRVNAGRTRIARVPRGLWLAILAPPVVVALAWPDRLDPGSAPRGELELPGHTEIIMAVTFSPDGRTLASGGLDHTVRLWDTTRWGDGRPNQPDVLLHPSWVYATAFSPDGSLLAAAGDGFATLWSSRPPYDKRSEWNGGFVRAVAFSPDGRALALAGPEDAIRLLEVPSARERMTLRGAARQDVMTIAFSPDGTLLASAYARGRVALWDVARGEERRVLLEYSSHPISSVAFSPDGRSVALVEYRPQASDVLIIDPESGAIRARLAGQLLGNAIASTADGRSIAVAGADRSVRLFDLETAKPLGALDVHACWPRSIAFSPDGRWLAYAADDNAVRVVDLASAVAGPGPDSVTPRGTVRLSALTAWD
jgi:WD40 repeat protein